MILVILVASGLLGFWQERRAAGAVDRLLAMIHTTARARRDGAFVDVPVADVVRGDVVQIGAGALVPADARLLDATDLHVDQAALTGESVPSHKCVVPTADDENPLSRRDAVFLGSHVVSGQGTAVVVRTGAATVFGAVAARLRLRPVETEFQHGIRRFGALLLEITLVLVVVIFAVNVAFDRPVLDSLLFTLALAVGLTPQLLPAIVGVTLAQGARHMAAARVIVRRLDAIEDLGGMEVLCTDKTGTLTEGVVAVHAVEDWTGMPSQRARIAACLNAAFETGYANPIDDALRALALPDRKEWQKLGEVPYDFARRRLSVALRGARGSRLVTKGAVAAVLDVCEEAEDADGRRVALADARDAITRRHEALSREGYRCLAVAERPLAEREHIDRDVERGLTFVGMLVLADPLKPHAADSLRELAALGVSVKLLTGDNRHVAERVAREVGLGTARVCTGESLRHLSEAALVTASAGIDVFAEVEPAQKERVIRALRKAGRAVGFLGDGINDAAALHAADVGISVDSATDVTRQAADVVLLAKELRVLADGVREGRRAFANTLKYVFITTSANFGNMVSMAAASLFAPFLPLLPRQLLLINALTDLPAMTIAGDRTDPELVASPRRWDTRAIRRFMIAFGLVSSVFDFVTIGLLLTLRVPMVAFRTAWFLESVLSELLVLLVIRTRRSLLRSRPSDGLVWASAGVLVVSLALPYTAAGRLLGFAPPAASMLLIVALIVAAYGVASELTKRALLRRTPL